MNLTPNLPAVKITYRTVLRPDFQAVQNNRRNTPTLKDYVTVPRLSLIGSYSVIQILSFEALEKLVRLHNRLSAK